MCAQQAKVVSIDRTSPDESVATQAESESRSVFDPPKMPQFLKGAARTHWQELVDNLMKHRLINELDADILAMYCQTYARWLDADHALDQVGMFQETPNGYAQYRPEFTAWRDLTGQALKLAGQLGLTPPARFKMKTGVPDEQSGFDF